MSGQYMNFHETILTPTCRKKKQIYKFIKFSVFKFKMKSLKQNVKKK